MAERAIPALSAQSPSIMMLQLKGMKANVDMGFVPEFAVQRLRVPTLRGLVVTWFNDEKSGRSWRSISVSAATNVFPRV
jgi:hypothetical protein